MGRESWDRLNSGNCTFLNTTHITHPNNIEIDDGHVILVT